MKPPSRSFLLPGYAVLLLVATPICSRANWPTYLHDSSRVGATSEQLKLPLTKRWAYESPTPPKMAWGGENGRVFEGYEMTNRVRFDEVFHVAIDGGRVFFGSSVDGCMYAVHQGSGKLLWRFFTDAPIRLAPTVVGQNLMVGSDDGYVYCKERP